MQFMYLRRVNKKKDKNPGRHPFGMIGVEKLEDGNVSIGVLTLYSGDRFEKFKGRQMMFSKIRQDRSALLTNPRDLPALTALLPGSILGQLDNRSRHQEILEKLVQDEFTGGQK